MTPRERILNCIRRMPIDRVPISSYELAGFDEDAWYNHDVSYREMMGYIRQKADCILMCDPDYFTPEDAIQRKNWTNGNSHYTEIVWQTVGGSFRSLLREDDHIKTVWTLEHFLKDTEDVRKFLFHPLEIPAVDMTNFFKKQTQLGQNGVMMITVDDPVCEAAGLMGMDLFLVTAVMEQEMLCKLLDKLFERRMKVLRNILSYDVKNVIFRIVGPEYCTPPYLSPQLFRLYETGYLTVMCEEIKAVGAIPRIHSHGKVKHVLDQFVEAGAMCIDPVEAPPDGDIELAEVKRLYGNKLTIFGNIELKDLENSPEDKIRDLVKKAIIDAGEGGGFVILPTATPINVPLSPFTARNFIVMLDTVHEFGKY